MTKVLRIRSSIAGIALWCVLFVIALAPIFAQGADAPASGPTEALYRQLSSIGLDPTRVYQVRDAAIDRSAVHISLEDGTIAFTRDVMGRITGAFFQGDGEVLLTPPNRMERESMSRFTGMAILEERFASAYFRFNDNTVSDLRPGLRAPEEAQDFASRWERTAENLAQSDAIRLLVDFSRLLPAEGGKASNAPAGFGDQMLHARLQGAKLGIFDVYVDSIGVEPVEAGQAKTAANGTTYYNVWTSFSPGSSNPRSARDQSSENQPLEGDWLTVRRYAIKAEVMPPKQIHAEARLQVEIARAGERTLVFELSRFLQVEQVEADGHPVEFIHNPAVEGTQRARQGNDVLAVIVPEPTHRDQKIELRFVYGGDVLAEAGSGLLYVGERGTWYPNRGFAMSDFDLEFHYPAGWTLVATGKPTTSMNAPAAPAGEQMGRWVSERPIPFAGFNLGKYKVATARAGNVNVEAYATAVVERGFPNVGEQVIAPLPANPARAPKQIAVLPPSTHPSPARNSSTVAEAAAHAVNYYAARFGPYPYDRLALTQMPGRESQGWPGLVFLSSYAFLTDEERADLQIGPVQTLLEDLTPAHETAHQWWGDLITWSSYRDQWLSEALANYSALMMLQENNPSGFRQIMEQYRQDLVVKDKDGEEPKDAGPVTLGFRLLSSLSPSGYQAISYGRGTWLLHMLRCMMLDAGSLETGRDSRTVTGPDEAFVRSLRKVRDRYQGRSISTRELLDVFAEDLPPSLRYEGKKSLDWFLEGWVNGTAMPTLHLAGVHFVSKQGAIQASGTIVQKDAPEDLVTSVPVYAVASGRQPVLIGRVFAEGEESSFRLPAPAGTHKLVLDPNETVLTNPKSR